MRHEDKGQPNPGPSNPLPEPLRPMAPEPQETTALGHDQTIEDIRELLLGTSIQDHERQLANLDARLNQVEVDLREEFTRRFNALDHYMKGEFESLRAQLKTQQEQQVSQHDLHDLLHEQSTRMTDEIRQKSMEILALLEQKLLALYQDKSGLNSLSSLFCDAALRLKDQARPVGSAVKRAPQS